MRRLRDRFLATAPVAVVTVAVVGAALVLPTAVAQTESREEALERLRGEIARLQASLGRVQQEQRSLENRLEQTRLELALQERRVEEARAARQLARERVGALEKRVAGLEEELEGVRGDLKRRLVALHRLGRSGYLRLLFALEDRSTALVGVRQIRYLARQDGDAVDAFVDARARLALEREELEAERARVETWVRQEEERRRRFEALRQEQRTLLARLDRRQTDLRDRTESLVDQARKLSNFLDFLYGRSSRALSGTPIQEFRGVLDRPAEGPIEIAFGPRRDERYGTLVPHNGIRIATRPGDPVTSVFPGKVLFASHFKGYGPTVVVHHPGRVFTLYAGLGEVGVGYGDVLSLGEPVGRAADALYFEIRVENRPEDPLGWLRN